MKTLTILPIYNQSHIISKSLTHLIYATNEETDILVIDDGSNDDVSSSIEEHENVKLLMHEKSLGFGATLVSGFQFAKDFDYNNIIILDIKENSFTEAFYPLLQSLKSGNDIVSCSRIEIQNDKDSEYSVYNIENSVGYKLNNITGYNLNDPFSPFKAFKIDSIKKLELEEFDEAFFIQAWIQSAYYGLQINEIHCEKISHLKLNETDFLEKDSEYYLNFIDSEKFLYPMDKIN